LLRLLLLCCCCCGLLLLVNKTNIQQMSSNNIWKKISSKYRHSMSPSSTLEARADMRITYQEKSTAFHPETTMDEIRAKLCVKGGMFVEKEVEVHKLKPGRDYQLVGATKIDQ